MAAEGSTPGNIEEVPAMWRPSGAWLSLLCAVHWAIPVGVLLAAGRWGTGGQGTVAGLLVSVLSLAVAFAVHEGGNYIAARASGMKVLLVRFGSLDIKPLRKGWKVRWKTPAHGGRYTLVYPVPDPNRSLRIASIAVSLGGAAATLVLAAVAAVGVALARDQAGRALFVTALCASITPLVYLFPSSKRQEGGAIEAWRWWHHPPDMRHLQFVLVHARLVSGHPASSFSEQELDALGAHMPMSRLWYAVKAAQQRGEWTEVVRFQEEWNNVIPTNPRMRAYLAEVTAITAAELKWMDAVQNRDITLLPDEDTVRFSSWANPTLGPRCRATLAWLSGDLAELAEATEATLTTADNSQDRSLVESERLILRALAATPR